MFEFIRGKLDYVCPEYISVEVNGVGYLILVPNPFLYMGKLAEEIIVYVYHHVREDSINLYGFSTRREREFFIKLLNVKGIGPKGSLAILATGDVVQVANGIETENENYLTKFPGVGKKTARQIILDLKGKLNAFLPSESERDQEVISQNPNGNEPLQEALLALNALGYSNKELEKIEKHLSSEKHTAEEYIKLALQFVLK